MDCKEGSFQVEVQSYFGPHPQNPGQVRNPGSVPVRPGVGLGRGGLGYREDLLQGPGDASSRSSRLKRAFVSPCCTVSQEGLPFAPKGREHASVGVRTQHTSNRTRGDIDGPLLRCSGHSAPGHETSPEPSTGDRPLLRMHNLLTPFVCKHHPNRLYTVSGYTDAWQLTYREVPSPSWATALAQRWGGSPKAPFVLGRSWARPSPVLPRFSWSIGLFGTLIKTYQNPGSLWNGQSMTVYV